MSLELTENTPASEEYWNGWNLHILGKPTAYFEKLKKKYGGDRVNKWSYYCIIYQRHFKSARDAIKKGY